MQNNPLMALFALANHGPPTARKRRSMASTDIGWRLPNRTKQPGAVKISRCFNKDFV
jgi:hypothetical protein